MSLADELLADLEDAGDVAEPQYIEFNDALLPTMGDDPMDIDPKFDFIRQVVKLRNSERFIKIMAQIEELITRPKREYTVGPVEANPEYSLIVEANNLALEIDHEIDTIYKFTTDVYSKRFTELSSLVPISLEYLLTAKELGNDLYKTKHSEILQKILHPATIMIISVTASSTQGQMLNQAELHQISESCDTALELNNNKLRIYEYVESRMSSIAPNLSMILGPSSAAKLIGVAGGLTKLSMMPSCNISVLGSQAKSLSGFSTIAIIPHAGFIYFSDFVQATPPDLRRKAARMLAGKCTLAARVDCSHTSRDGHVGRELKEEIQRKLDKLREPPPVKQIKPLPAPIDQPKKKRGGKRVRKMNERYRMTDLRKQANRINFGVIEGDAYQDDLGFNVGPIGKSGTGRIRVPQVDEKTKVRISKTLQKNLQQQQQVYGGTTSIRGQISGTASSVVFTPLQGLEIVNPRAQSKISEVNSKYFSDTASFLKV